MLEEGDRRRLSEQRDGRAQNAAARHLEHPGDEEHGEGRSRQIGPAQGHACHVAVGRREPRRRSADRVDERRRFLGQDLEEPGFAERGENGIERPIMAQDQASRPRPNLDIAHGRNCGGI
ncbi:hypothetical protein L1787_15815 [Acuticoccus sp. M5D2P5]|uniref:hypothetical protein n=1 Tax=Acuticoccus kalidii TaxID=2910977 RepID=UPI001F324C5F|nr:hypothetical protein [Acuticoccus kalidii]MCF3934870.1 hypothetical protein [Acuticoccus kalidii]